MSESGCCSKLAASVVSRWAIWRFSSLMIPTAAIVVAANASATASGAASLGGCGSFGEHLQRVAIGQVSECF